MSSSSQLSLPCPSSPEVGHVLVFSADRTYGLLGIFLRVLGNDLYLPGPALWCWLRDGPSSAALCATCKWIRSRTATWDCYSCFRPWLWVHVDRAIVSTSSEALVNATVRMLSRCLVCRESPNMAAGVYQLLVDETYPQYGVCELVEPPPPALIPTFSQQPAASRMVPWANALEIWYAVILGGKNGSSWGFSACAVAMWLGNWCDFVACCRASSKLYASLSLWKCVRCLYPFKFCTPRPMQYGDLDFTTRMFWASRCPCCMSAVVGAPLPPPRTCAYCGRWMVHTTLHESFHCEARPREKLECDHLGHGHVDPGPGVPCVSTSCRANSDPSLSSKTPSCPDPSGHPRSYLAQNQQRRDLVDFDNFGGLATWADPVWLSGTDYLADLADKFW